MFLYILIIFNIFLYNFPIFFFHSLQLIGSCALLQGRVQERIGCKQEALHNYWRALQLDPFCFDALLCIVRLSAITYQQRALRFVPFLIYSIYSTRFLTQHIPVPVLTLVLQGRRLSGRSAQACLPHFASTARRLRRPTSPSRTLAQLQPAASSPLRSLPNVSSL